MNKLEQIEEAWSKATEGPYREGTLNVWRDTQLRCVAKTERGDYVQGEFKPYQKGDSREQMQADCRFLALSWEAVRDLLTLARAAIAVCNRCQFKPRVCDPGCQFLEVSIAADPLLEEVKG